MSTTTAPEMSTATEDSRHPTPIGEAEFLKQEAERARTAISESLGAIGKSLGRAADPHRLTKDHPWIAIGAAAVAGFAAASTLIPSKEQQAMKALAAIERSLQKPEEKEKESDKKSSSVPSGFLGLIFAELFKLLRPLLTALITNATTSQSTPAEEKAANSAAAVSGDNASGHTDPTPGISAPS